MKTRSNDEWEREYRQVWRWPFAHLPKEIRAKLVRGCRGKAVYISVEEALPVMKDMPVRPGLYLKAYLCPLCFEDTGGVKVPCFHIGNSRTPNTMPERAIDPLRQSESRTELD